MSMATVEPICGDPDEVRASELVRVVEATWDAIRAAHPDVPPVMATLGSGSIRKGFLTLGHFAAKRWVQGDGAAATTHELFLGGEGLRRGADEVMATLLHEAAHAVSHARGVKDTSRQGRWHNAKFKATAEELGLIVEKTSWGGWTTTKLSATSHAIWSEHIDQLRAAIRTWRREEGEGFAPKGDNPGAGTDGDDDGDDEEETPKKKGRVTLLCRCAVPRRLWMTASVWELGGVICVTCGETFEQSE